MPTERISSSSWESISDKLRDALNAGTYGKWFGSASALEETDEVLVVGVPNEFTEIVDRESLRLAAGRRGG